MKDTKALLNIIDDLEKEYIKFWQDLCEIESPTLYKQGVDAVGQLIVDKIKNLDFQIERHPLEGSGDAYTITLNKDAKKKPIVLSAHMDTVHQIGSFASPRTKIEGNTLYGPGVTDDKGGLACALYAMDALQKAGLTDRPIKFFLQPDEENGSKSSNMKSIELMLQAAQGCAGFFNLEWYRHGKVILWRKGSLDAVVKVHGLSAHGCRCYLGHSAIAQAASMICQLEKHKSSDGISCNVGIINGGHYEASVPDYCEFTCGFNYMTSKEKQAIIDELNDLCENPVVEGTTCEYTSEESFPNMVKLDSAFELLDKMNAIYKELGMVELEATWSQGGSDASRMSQYGIPTIDSFGVHGQYIHTPQEEAELSSLKDAALRIATVCYLLED